MKTQVLLLLLTAILLVNCQADKKESKASAEVPQDPIQMERLYYEISIDATPMVVYQVITGKATFEKWTAEFSPISTYEGSWDQGTEMKFISTMEDGSTAGMISLVRENRPNEYIGLTHIGMIQNGEEIREGPEIDIMKGAEENYSILPDGEGALLKIDTHTYADYKSYFEETWPKGLAVIKEMAESQNN
ncbi:MAG: SRPBCC domain-containing protein [Bacteroidota bacterium]